MRKLFLVIGFPLRLFLFCFGFVLFNMVDPGEYESNKKDLLEILRGQ